MAAHHDPDEPLEDVVEDIASHNRDDTTRREALELELEDEGRSDAGEQIGQHVE